MTGELLTRAYVQSIAPRSTEKLMKYVSSELGDECTCPLRIDVEERDSELITGGDEPSLSAQIIYSFPHGS